MKAMMDEAGARRRAQAWHGRRGGENITAQTTLDGYVTCGVRTLHVKNDEAAESPRVGVQEPETLEKIQKFMLKRQGASNLIDFEELLKYDLGLTKALLDNPRWFLREAGRVAGGRVMVRGLDTHTEHPRARHVGHFIMIRGHVVNSSDGGSRIEVQYLPKIWIWKLDAPLHVKSYPRWGGSWPLRCKVPSDLIGTVGLGDFVEVTGTLTVERDNETLTTGWHFLLDVNHIGSPPKETEPRHADCWELKEGRLVAEAEERIFGHAPIHTAVSDTPSAKATPSISTTKAISAPETAIVKEKPAAVLGAKLVGGYPDV